MCNRCGKQRILTKTWTEFIETSQGKSELVYTQYACPDDACQSMVDEELAAKHAASVERQKAADMREEARIASRAKAIQNSRTKKTITS